MKKYLIGIIAALYGFSVSAEALHCFNPSENMQVCTGNNGYSVTCVKTGNIITCTGTDGTVHSFVEN